MNDLVWDIGPILLVGGLVAIAWFVLRFKPSRIDSLDEFEQLLGKGRPLVVKFFANT